MKKSHLFVLFGLLTLLAAARWPANATTVTKTYKMYSLTILVTPSPIAYRPGPSTPTLAREIGVPFAKGAVLASGSALASDVPLGAYSGTPFMIAQAQKSVPVQFNAQADPYAAYLKILPQLGTANAAYGNNTYTCAVKVFAYYPNRWRVVDWVNGTTSGGTGVYPTYNYPQTSLLSWLAEGFTTSFQPFYNNGSPGELTFSGAAGQSITACIDLQLNVPSTLAAGYYSASIQYTLQTY